MPSSYTLSLESIDGIDDYIELETTNITQEGNLVILNVTPVLPHNRVWNFTVLAYGCPQNKLLSGVELSKFDVWEDLVV